MKLHAHRPWITPLVIGAFLLSSVTGVLMFFHLDSGLNKVAHEWLSWAMVLGVSLHVLLNLPAFKRYFGQKIAWAVMGVFALVLALSFISPLGAKKEPPFGAPIHALAQAPLPVLAQVLGLSTQDLNARLAKSGWRTQNENPKNETATLADLVGPDLRKQIGALNQLLSKP